MLDGEDLVWLDDVGLADLPRVGAKLALALPDRIVQAFAELAERTELGDRLSSAVRSSGVSEDGADASFADQYDTYLGLH